MLYSLQPIIALLNSIQGGTVTLEIINTALATIDGYQDVPAANATTNALMREVVGNKADIANTTASQASLIGLLRALIAQITAVQGGSQTLESIGTDVKNVFDMTHTAASVTMTGSEVTLFEFVPTAPSMFEGGKIDLTNMAAGDTIVVKTYHKIKSGGNYILETSTSYADDVSPDLKVINGFACRYGVKITATQSAGTNRIIDCAFATSAPGV